jgi:hypothetical protein
MSRAHLLPIARTNTVAPYVQVREIGSGPSRRWFWSGESWHAGVTLDLLNRGALPTTIELSRARLIVRSFDGSETASVRPLEGGPGGLPARIDGDEKAIESLTLIPAEARSVWIVFDTIAPWPMNPTVTLTLVAVQSPGAETSVQLTLRTPSEPMWLPETNSPTRWGGLFRLEGRVFGRDGYTAGGEYGLWIARRPLSGDLGVRLGGIYVPGTARLVEGSMIGPAASLAWHPFGWRGGVYGAGGLSYLDIRDPSVPPHQRWAPDVGGGLEVSDFRIGYVHTFRSGTPLANGVLVAWTGSFEL